MLEEKVNELVSEFWTRKNEMEESVESVGLYVVESNDEYVTVAAEDIDEQAVLYLGHANKTMWIERIVILDENGFEKED
ncbi:hypothetical protein [Phascolarctobacterium succinatutens]|uniref:hypothetical protein n=1 Tax=Phascolarctobacterium succinatutens TaxID=626940 RepID=UPI0026EFC586|nr:hypothetical protein [Phascolarctobacterium succinatutens]